LLVLSYVYVTIAKSVMDHTVLPLGCYSRDERILPSLGYYSRDERILPSLGYYSREDTSLIGILLKG
jgi:hypothetical protein